MQMSSDQDMYTKGKEIGHKNTGKHQTAKTKVNLKF